MLFSPVSKWPCGGRYAISVSPHPYALLISEGTLPGLSWCKSLSSVLMSRSSTCFNLPISKVHNLHETILLAALWSTLGIRWSENAWKAWIQLDLLRFSVFPPILLLVSVVSLFGLLLGSWAHHCFQYLKPFFSRLFASICPTLHPLHWLCWCMFASVIQAKCLHSPWHNEAFVNKRYLFPRVI